MKLLFENWRQYLNEETQVLGALEIEQNFVKSNNLLELEFIEDPQEEEEALYSGYSDLHKEYYGFRPDSEFSSWPLEKLKQEYDKLSALSAERY